MILVSACLLGECCKYSGGHNRNQAVLDYLADRQYLPVCPEALGGLPVPRPPAEIVGGRAAEVIAGRAPIRNDQGEDVTAAFLSGAEQVAALARTHGAKLAILKERSPSCGVHQVYDGSFTGSKQPGLGVCALLLRQLGLELRSEEDFEQQSNAR